LTFFELNTVQLLCLSGFRKRQSSIHVLHPSAKGSDVSIQKAVYFPAILAEYLYKSLINHEP